MRRALTIDRPKATVTARARVALVLLAALALAATDCLHGHRNMSARTPTQLPSTICPFGLRGVRVGTDDVEGGIDVTLTTLAGDLEELRRRAHAAIDGPHAEEIPSRHQIVDVDAELVVRVRAVDPRPIEALRAAVRRRIDAAGDPELCAP